MRNFFLLLIILSGHFYSSGQSIERVEIVDSLHWGEFSKSQMDSFYFELNPIRYSSHKINLRVSFAAQTIDLFSDNDSSFSGLLTNYIMEYGEDTDEKSAKDLFIFKKVQVDSTLSTKVALAILGSGQTSIPKDTIAKHWNGIYLHCHTLSIDFKTDTVYQYQKFHCVGGQPEGTPYKELVLSNYHKIVDGLSLDSLYQDFVNSLPRGKTYSKDDRTQIYFLSDEQMAYFEKNREHFYYMDSIRDTLNNYLSDTLNKIFTAYFPNTEYHGRFFIIITKRGKLKKFINNQEFYWISDRWDYWRCKQKIRKAFRRIDLDFVKTKRNYFKEISIWDGEIIVSQ